MFVILHKSLTKKERKYHYEKQGNYKSSYINNYLYCARKL